MSDRSRNTGAFSAYGLGRPAAAPQPADPPAGPPAVSYQQIPYDAAAVWSWTWTVVTSGYGPSYREFI